jgi:hypothetical protein
MYVHKTAVTATEKVTTFKTVTYMVLWAAGRTQKKGFIAVMGIWKYFGLTNSKKWKPVGIEILTENTKRENEQ